MKTAGKCRDFNDFDLRKLDGFFERE